MGSINPRGLGLFTSLFYAVITALLILSILLIKSFRTSGVLFIYFYSIFVTTFMLSRIIGSLFYKSPSKKIEPGKEPTVTFVIPCKNEEKAIYETIKNCATADYPKEKIEIIAINDGSTDNTIKEMQRAKNEFADVNITIIHWAKNRGKREGMNFGFRKAMGEIIIQLDSDSYPAPNALKYLVTPFENPDIAIVSAHSEPANKDQNMLTKMQAAYYFMSFRALKATESIFNIVFCCPGCCSAYRKKYIIPALKEFNEETFLGRKYSFGDDRSLTNHMIKRGYKTIYVEDALAFTIVPDNIKQLLKQQIRWKKSWFINTLMASKFILQRDTFVALTYFFPLLLFTILTPIVAFKAMIINPIIYGISPMVYIFGILIVSLLSYIHNKIYDGKKYGKYIFLWSILNMTILCYLIVYALVFDLKNVSWGTR
ncbi:MAG: glycosyltransferase family 2 protein [Nanoarchaeota archaeon]|nr:glycosyltransferase family 2 protein [Nanoarchaeota archaeon]